MPLGSGGHCWGRQEETGVLDSFFSRLMGNAFPGDHSLNTSWSLVQLSSCLLPQAPASLHYLWCLRTLCACAGCGGYLGLRGGCDGIVLIFAEEGGRDREELPLGLDSVCSRPQDPCFFFLSIFMAPLMQATHRHLSAFDCSQAMSLFSRLWV